MQGNDSIVSSRPDDEGAGVKRLTNSAGTLIIVKNEAAFPYIREGSSAFFGRV